VEREAKQAHEQKGQELLLLNEHDGIDEQQYGYGVAHQVDVYLETAHHQHNHERKRYVVDISPEEHHQQCNVYQDTQKLEEEIVGIYGLA
jgi:hypothetical protein